MSRKRRSPAANALVELAVGLDDVRSDADNLGSLLCLFAQTGDFVTDEGQAVLGFLASLHCRIVRDLSRHMDQAFLAAGYPQHDIDIVRATRGKPGSRSQRPPDGAFGTLTSVGDVRK